EGAEALIVIAAEELEISARRAAPHTEPQAVSRQHLDRLDAMSEIDRMAQGYLQHGNAEFDPLGDGAQGRERYERVEGRPASTERVSDPDSGEPRGLDPARVIDDAAHRPVLDFRTRAQADLNTYLHAHLPVRGSRALARADRARRPARPRAPRRSPT